MKSEELYLKILRWGIIISLFIPLIIFKEFLSPFHFGKVVVFRSLVEILAIFYILLIISNKKYRPRWTPLLIVFTIFTGFYALTSVTGVSFQRSFWGTLERMGGLYSFLHYWAYFIILTSVIKTRKDWYKILKVSIFVGFFSILFAYGQHFKLGDFFIGWQREGRVIGTIGNAALFAGYLLFILFLALLFLLKKSTTKRGRIFYALVFILGTHVLFMTAVRGAVFSFVGVLFLLGLFYLFKTKNRKIKIYALCTIIILLILVSFVWLNRNQPWIKEHKQLGRLANVSFKSETVQTRLWSWHSGWQGWKEKFLLGWGPENFMVLHAMYFDPRHFTGFGSETIWDRAHNVLLDTGATMGIFGLFSYLSIFVLIYYLLIKRFKQKRISILTASVLGATILAYFGQNLFIFDTFANYFVFFLVLGYINFITAKKKEKPTEEIIKETEISLKRPNMVLISILLVLVIFIIYKTNIEPAKANYACTRAILLGRTGEIEKTFQKYQEALSYKTLQGKDEIRQKLAKFAVEVAEYQRKEEGKINFQIHNYTLGELIKNIETYPLETTSYLYAGRLYILLIREGDNSAGEKAEEFIKKALALNKGNPRYWYELGQAYLSQGKLTQSVETFETALDLNPNLALSQWFLGMVYFRAGEIQKALEHIEKALDLGYYEMLSLSDIKQLINVYYQVKDFQKIVDLYKLAVYKDPKDPQLHASLAAAYAAIGDYQNAAFEVQKAAALDPTYATEAMKFIDLLK